MNLYNSLKKHVEESFSWPDKQVYHYTPTKEAVIHSQYLKLSKHEDLNKKGNRELHVAIKLIKEQLQKRDNLSLQI